MHYYKKNIGDYSKKAGRLSILQHGVYNLLIDCCYDRERFPTLEEAIDWVWAGSKEEIEAVEFVLRRFFILEDGVYVQKRIQEEIDDYHQKKITNKRIAEDREKARREAKITSRDKESTKRDESLSEEHEAPPNHKPLTTNHKPLTINHNPKTDTADADLSAASQRVFDYWQAVMDKPGSRFTDNRRKKIKARLQSFSLEQLKKSIDGCRDSPFHMGDNDQKTEYNAIEFICRNDEKVEFFINKLNSSQAVNSEIEEWINAGTG